MRRDEKRREEKRREENKICLNERFCMKNFPP